MVCAIYIIPNMINTMKTIITIITALLFCNCLEAQQGIKVVKQPPKVNGVLKATTNATTKVKIHANSNTVHGTGNTKSAYKKPAQKKSGEKEETPVNKSKASKPKK